MHWTHDYYEQGYSQRWSLSPPTPETDRDADGLWAHLRLSQRTPLLDVGCGHGRLAIALRRRGAQVTGLDAASSLLTRAAQLAHQLRVDVCWVRGDMRWLPVRRHTIAAALLFDAFGFFETDAENQLVLRELARVLTPAARLALKIANAAPILENFHPSDQETRGTKSIDIARSLLSDPARLVEDIVIRSPEGVSRFQRRQRLYHLADVRSALGRAGFVPVLEAAAIDGARFDANTSPSMLIVAERRPDYGDRDS